MKLYRIWLVNDDGSASPGLDYRQQLTSWSAHQLAHSGFKKQLHAPSSHSSHIIHTHIPVYSIFSNPSPDILHTSSPYLFHIQAFL